MTLAAVQSARVRFQASTEAVYTGTVVIAGNSYPAAVLTMQVRPEQRSDGTGFVNAQRASALVRKNLLKTQPARETVVLVNGVSFTLDSVGCQNANDVAWKLNLVRIP